MKLIVFVVTHLIVLNVFPHPVIYKDGWVYQSSFMPEMNQSRIGYSVTSRYALVVNSNHFKNIDNYRDYSFGVNFLLKRWFGQDSQANIYTGVHGGYYKDDLSEGEVGHSFVMADWESREHYVVVKSEAFLYDNRDQYSHMARYGFAPYVAGMNELQTWLVLQALYYEEQSRAAIITPMLRFFYRNVLWELGYSTRGQSYLTLMVHY